MQEPTEEDGTLKRINRTYELYPINKDELETCKALLQANHHTSIMIMPTHRINELGEFEGFRFNAGSHINAGVMPLSRKMFFGTTMTECIIRGGGDNRGINEQANVLLNDLEGCRAKMQAILQRIHEGSMHDKACFQCMPENVYAQDDDGEILLSDYKRSVDSKPWNPEPPETVGIYHAYTRSFINDAREQRLYIVCSGGLHYASHEFYNLVLSLGDDITAAQLYECEEAHWLRKASQRARLKIIKMVADEFGLDIPVEKDLNEYRTEDNIIASPTTDTIHNDIHKISSDVVAIYNHSCNTEQSDNGILCPMHPCEGVWLFKGPKINFTGYQSYGSGFGSQFVCGAFPTGSYHLSRVKSTMKGAYHHAKKEKQKICTISMDMNRNNVVTIPNSIYSMEHRENENLDVTQEYFHFDEPFMKNLECMEWNRDNGVVELIPIIVGLG